MNTMITIFENYKDIKKFHMDELGNAYLYNTIAFHKDGKYYNTFHPAYFNSIRNYARRNNLEIDTSEYWQWKFLGKTLDEVKDKIDRYFTEIESDKYNL